MKNYIKNGKNLKTNNMILYITIQYVNKDVIVQTIGAGVFLVIALVVRYFIVNSKQNK